MDPETEFLLLSKTRRIPEIRSGTAGNEWELFKENVRPVKRGRNVNLLNQSLKSHSDSHIRDSLLHTRTKLIQAIDEYEGEDPLQPWLQCIKWVQDAFPCGGDSSGIVVIFEQCVRTFWHDPRYKNDLRYLKLWVEYAGFCDDAQVVYSFLETNKIGEKHSLFYISYASLMESNNKIKTASDIYESGISKNAQPIEKLKSAYKKFFTRSMSRPKASEEELVETHLPARSFGTILARGDSGNRTQDSFDIARKRPKQEGTQGGSIKILKDVTNISQSTSLVHQSEPSLKPSWHTLGARAERNKENNAIPSKWTSNKIPQRPVGRMSGAAAAAPCIEVFVDEECLEPNNVSNESKRSSALQLRDNDGKDLKKETELLRENPLRHFPPSSLR
uniref:mitotic spindle checkpoint protein BUBR1 n=1 Tax=Erigeron canadensis TaxID=72917 RepID=UPI001CB90105|nr:mitotic spindle checkpoint protein BUBR1 [Erigeron canadensis]